jgi:hypothetical protein
MMIVAADAAFMGIRFREVSVSVLARGTGMAAGLEGAYLVHAWNSRRLFAWCERVLFKTPYSRGDVAVTAAVPASVHLRWRGEERFAAEMLEAPEDQGQAVQGGWGGPVFLPGRGRGPADQKVFFVRLAGATWTYPFREAAEDRWSISSTGSDDPLGAVIESRFAPAEWAIRPDATHSKSKTYCVANLPFVPAIA